MGSNQSDEIIKELTYISDLYHKHYNYIYNFVIVYAFKKPIEPVLEIERAFSHLVQAVRELKEEKNDSKAISDNITRMNGHIERCLLDLYKLGFYYLWETIKKYRGVLIEIKPDEFLKIESFFRKTYKDVREKETEHMGNDKSGKRKQEVLEAYKLGLKMIEKKWDELLDSLKGKIKKEISE